MYSLIMSRKRAPARGRLTGQNALSKRPGRFERPVTQALDDSGCLEEEADASAAGGAPVARDPLRASGLILPVRPPELPGNGHCLAGDTPILMADGSTRALGALKAGDLIIGTVREGGQRRYVTTQVLARWSVIQPAVRILLEDGTEVIAGGGHRFLTTRGWKLVSGSPDAGPPVNSALNPSVNPTENPSGNPPGRPTADLRVGDRLLGTGAFAPAPVQDLDYRRGYLCGLFRGYACPEPRAHTPGRVRLAQRDPPPLIPCSGEAWERAQRWLREWRSAATPPPRAPLAMASGRGYPVQAVSVPAACPHEEEIQDAIHWPVTLTRAWCAGFLGGVFDASGSYEGGVLRICHPDPAVIGRIGEALRMLNMARSLELVKQAGRLPSAAVRIEGGLPAHLRFFHSCDPAIAARRDIAGQLVTSGPRLAVVAIERLRIGRRLHDITTGTGDFVANGLVSHNWDPSAAPADSRGLATCLSGTAAAGVVLEEERALRQGSAGRSAPLRRPMPLPSSCPTPWPIPCPTPWPIPWPRPMPLPIRTPSSVLRRDPDQPPNPVKVLRELRAARVLDGLLVVPATLDDGDDGPPRILRVAADSGGLRDALRAPPGLPRELPADWQPGGAGQAARHRLHRHVSTIDAFSLLTTL